MQPSRPLTHGIGQSPRRSLTTSATSASSTARPTIRPVASGMDIARTEDGLIIELYMIVTEIRQPS
jgi:hypothetical protein